MIDTTIPQFRIQIFPKRSLVKGKQWYACIIGRNNEIVWQTEGHKNQSDVTHVCDRTRAFIGNASITVYAVDPRKGAR